MEIVTIYAMGVTQGNPGPAEIQVEIRGANEAVLAKSARSIGNATVDYAAYEAVVAGLRSAVELFGDACKTTRFTLVTDNLLVAQHLNAQATITNPGLVPFFVEVYNLRVEYFTHLEIPLP